MNEKNKIEKILRKNGYKLATKKKLKPTTKVFIGMIMSIIGVMLLVVFMKEINKDVYVKTTDYMSEEQRHVTINGEEMIISLSKEENNISEFKQNMMRFGAIFGVVILFSMIFGGYIVTIYGLFPDKKEDENKKTIKLEVIR